MTRRLGPALAAGLALLLVLPAAAAPPKEPTKDSAKDTAKEKSAPLGTVGGGKGPIDPRLRESGEVRLS